MHSTQRHVEPDFLNIRDLAEPIRRKEIKKEELKQASETQSLAKKLYLASKKLQGSSAHKYLRIHRNISNTKGFELRALESVYTYHGKKKTYVPALLAPTFDEKGRLNNVQIIRINPKDFSKDEASNLKKQTLGATNGYGCELNKNHNNGTTYIAEGVETGLSILEANPDARVVVSFGISNFKNLKFDKFGKDICFCLDNDGKAVPQNKAVLSAFKTASGSGKNISYVIPKQAGMDLNDVLQLTGKEGVKSVLKNQLSATKAIQLSETHQTKTAKRVNNEIAFGDI